MSTVALHACCGPCLIEPLDALLSAHDVTIVYANPNIHPLSEYRRRRDVLLEYAAGRGIEVVEVPYDPAMWLEATAGLWSDPPRRCRACFDLRLKLTADVAKARGLRALATTLTVSPYQDPDAVREAAQSAAAAAGLAYAGEDYRDRYPQATRRSRELGMYRQNYCGCLLSEIEAERDRERRRQERRARRGHERSSSLPGQV
ncbi:MAG: epoxyqueuosine reductase QueH [Coriobacteriales bacterium]